VDKEHPLDRSDVVINHLRQKEGKTFKEEVTIDSHGNLSWRPAEFFDQAEKDLSDIVKRRFGPS
jgi:predicted ATPase